MPIYRVLFGFSGANQGWTEVHAINASASSAPAVLPLTVPVAQARAAMLGSPFVLNGTRVSIYSDGGSPPKRVARGPILDKRIYSNAGGPAAGAPAEPYPVQLQAQGFVSAPAPPGITSTENWTYLGGPPDDCVTNAGQVLPDKLGLAASFNQWKAAMIQNNFGWLGVLKIGNKIPITSITNLGSGQIEYVVADSNVPPIVSGTYNVRVSGVNGGRSPANGAYIVDYDATKHSAITREQVAFALLQSGGMIQFYAQCNQFIPYANLVLAAQTIKHKRGRPFLSAPGRARRRIRA
jgi:hypothetical protein